MIQRIIFILILSLLITSCGGAAATQAPAATESPVATEGPGFPLVSDTQPFETPNLSDATQTSTSAPTDTPAITPTDTQLPPLDLPTEAVSAPAKMVWDGVPTYPGDSAPGYSFRVTYDPDLWAVTSDQFGYPALGHRKIEYCIISVTSGRGLPPSLTVEHDVLYTDTVTFDVGIAYENGIRQFVTYTGGDRTVITAFEVSFQDQADACIADAVMVLSTLRSVADSQATPEP